MTSTVALAHQGLAAVLADEDRSRGRQRTTRRRVGQGVVSARDQDTTARVEGVREEVPEPPVLPGRDTGRSALADLAVVDDTPGRVHRLDLRLVCRCVQDVRLVD